MLPKLYAQALYKAGSANAPGVLKNLEVLLQRKGHERLMPAIAREFKRVLQRQVDAQGILEVARTGDVSKLTAQVAYAASKLNLNPDNLDVRENPDLVGGYLMRTKDSQIDGSYRRALLNLYSRLIA